MNNEFLMLIAGIMIGAFPFTQLGAWGVKDDAGKYTCEAKYDTPCKLIAKPLRVVE